VEVGGEGKTNEVKGNPIASTQTIPEDVRDELTSFMQELLVKIHELSFEYSTADCTQELTCPLALKSRELFKVVKKLNTLVKKMATPK